MAQAEPHVFAARVFIAVHGLVCTCQGEGIARRPVSNLTDGEEAVSCGDHRARFTRWMDRETQLQRRLADFEFLGFGLIGFRKNDRNAAELVSFRKRWRRSAMDIFWARILRRNFPVCLTHKLHSGPNCSSNSLRRRAAKPGFWPLVEIAICSSPRRTTAG